ncbi:metallophosphoesterase family protein [Candidatus Bathyarchaeota archaeon]|nr:metallophosphoesterase family protein [Candidatus Bathyarchaeota archaeon]
MRIAVLSDVHANLEALESVLSSLAGYDSLFFLGDLVGYGAEPNEVVDRVHALNPDVVICGNHDYAVVTGDTSDFSVHAALAVEWTRRRLSPRNLDYLASLPCSARLEHNGLRLAAYHGSPRDPINEYVFPGTSEHISRSMIELAEADVLLLGHTHVPMQAETSSGCLFNPGSVGQPRDGDPRASYAILSIEEEKVDFKVARVSYDVDSAASKILQGDLPEFLADRLHLGY